MNFLQIRNWGRWQTYRSDRTPPWIKLHRTLLLNVEWQSLSDAEKGQIVSIWILAAERNGRIPDDPYLLAKICNLDTMPDLDRFLGLDFLEKIKKRRRRASAKDVALDVEKEKEEERDQPLPSFLNEKIWTEWIKFHKENRRILKPTQVRYQWKQLAGWHEDGQDTTAIIEKSIANGWKGLFPLDKRSNGADAAPRHFV